MKALNSHKDTHSNMRRVVPWERKLPEKVPAYTRMSSQQVVKEE